MFTVMIPRTHTIGYIYKLAGSDVMFRQCVSLADILVSWMRKIGYLASQFQTEKLSIPICA